MNDLPHLGLVLRQAGDPESWLPRLFVVRLTALGKFGDRSRIDVTKNRSVLPQLSFSATANPVPGTTTIPR